MEQDKTEGKRIIEESRNKLLLILIVSKILSVLFAVWFSLRITSSLKKLSIAVRKANEPGSQVEFSTFHSSDEISDLNREIQKLLASKTAP